MSSKAVALTALLLIPAAQREALGQRAATPGAVRAYATIHSLGIEWDISGDTDHDATVFVRYRLQGATYALAVEQAIGEPVVDMVFAFLALDGATEASIPDLDAAKSEIRTTVATA